MTDEEWDEYLDRWRNVVRGLHGRLPEEALEEILFWGVQEPFYGIGALLGGHEQGMHQLTPEEEDELWELASLTECADDDLLNAETRAKSVHDRPIRRVRPKHPLRGGGHGPGRGKPGKREFPASWSDDSTMAHTMDVARRPDSAVKLANGDFLARGVRDGVELAVVVGPSGDVLTSYPVRGPGVVDNPLDEWRGPASSRLQALLDELVPPEDQRRAVLDELMAVGEWPYVVLTLRAIDGRTAEQDVRLAELARAAGL